MKFERIDRSDFWFTPRAEDGSDKFATTFVAKADALKLWPNVIGMISDDGMLMAAICVRISQRSPLVANLQLLHTFSKFRRRGFASRLVEREYLGLYQANVQYFRVSSEPDAQEFYRSLGLKFWGEQKSGSLLCIHQVMTPNPRTGRYDPNDEFVKGLLFSGRRGSLTKPFDFPK